VKTACHTTALTLAQEVTAYACDFELIRIGMRAGCRRKNPYEALERLWTLVYKAVPAAGNEMSELIVAHRRCIGTFRDLAQQQEGGASAALRQARAAHLIALAALLHRLGPHLVARRIP
jgi:hypothetical protein